MNTKDGSSMGYNEDFCGNPLLSSLPNQLCETTCLVTKEERAKQKWPLSHLVHKWGSMTKIIIILIRKTELLHVLGQHPASSVRLIHNTERAQGREPGSLASSPNRPLLAVWPWVSCCFRSALPHLKNNSSDSF